MQSQTMPVVVASSTRSPKPKKVVLGVSAKRAEDTFIAAMLEAPCDYQCRNPLEWVISLVAQGLVIAALILAPLYCTQTLDLKAFQNNWLVTPLPPPPAPAITVRAVKSIARLIEGGRMIAPSVIPKSVAIIKEAPLPPDSDVEGIVGGVPGGIPGGQLGGVLGGIIGGTGHPSDSAVAPPPQPMKRTVRVGGNVKPPKQIRSETPVYPILAKQTHIQGTVLIDAVIDEQGNVVQAHVIGGPVLLIQSALETVLKWKYEPSYLNGQPISVEMHVEVHFVLL
jgi:periplasmic protein TonB